MPPAGYPAFLQYLQSGRVRNLSRFLDTLGYPVHLAAMHDGFDRMVQHLGGVVPNLGARLAGDATALSARRSDAARQEGEVRLGLPQPAGGGV